MQNADVFISFALIHNANKTDGINLQQSFCWVFLIQMASLLSRTDTLKLLRVVHLLKKYDFSTDAIKK